MSAIFINSFDVKTSVSHNKKLHAALLVEDHKNRYIVLQKGDLSAWFSWGIVYVSSLDSFCLEIPHI